MAGSVVPFLANMFIEFDRIVRSLTGNEEITPIPQKVFTKDEIRQLEQPLILAGKKAIKKGMELLVEKLNLQPQVDDEEVYRSQFDALSVHVKKLVTTKLDVLINVGSCFKAEFTHSPQEASASKVHLCFLVFIYVNKVEGEKFAVFVQPTKWLAALES